MHEIYSKNQLLQKMQEFDPTREVVLSYLAEKSVLVSVIVNLINKRNL